MDPVLQKMIDNMPEKTGKSLAEWKAVLSSQHFDKHGQAVKYLKTEHGVTHGFANTIVTLHRKDNEEKTDLVADQYKGKEHLRPIYDRLLEVVHGFGLDVLIKSKK